MELRHLRYFVAAAEFQNFHHAAEHLNLVQPALSRQIRDLENELEVTLFERLPRGVRLTAAGRAYAAEARAILAAVDTAGQTARRVHRGQQGELRIGISDLASTSPAVMTALRTLRARLPLINLQLVAMTTPAQVEALQADRLEAGLIFGYHWLPDTLELSEVASYDQLLVMPNDHRLASRDSICVADLRDEDFIVSAVIPEAREVFLNDARSIGLEPRIVQSAPSTELVLGLVAAGAGVAFVNSSVLGRTSPFVVTKPMADVNLKRRLIFACKRGQSNVLVAQFKDLITAAAQDGAPS